MSHVSSLTRMSGARIPCLDGLRAVSIFGVAFAHLQGTRGFPTFFWMGIPGDLGNLGVRFFFVISGYLITHLLLKEWQSTGSISLCQFYLRRTFRIFPAFYGYLLVVGLLAIAGIIAVSGEDFVYAATYLINFVHRKSWEVGHLWSLAVEEQFYLIWPLTIVLLGWKRATIGVIAIVLLAPVLRIATWYLLPEWRGIITKAFPTVCDAIAIGCVLACVRSRLLDWKLYAAFTRSWWFILVPLAIFASNAFSSHTRPDFLIGQSVRNIGIAMCLDWCLRYPDSIIGRLLNLKGMVWLGGLSYSFYLWQQLFLNRKSDAVWCSFPLNLLLALMAALGSFYLIEKPCLRLRVRFFSPKPEPEKVNNSTSLPQATLAPESNS
jgi:peptidoglycan/LPS O-acetylase OafA/YrhL